MSSNVLQSRNQLLSIDQQLQLMNTINNMVRASQFTAQLANTIFTLCAQLKTSGSMLEQSHKNELNKVFTSLRQACCRDNGQLGTPCRLKIMELVELRAMNWRTNLAHSQYYVNRPEQQHDPAPAPAPTSPSSNSQSSLSYTPPAPPPPNATPLFMPGQEHMNANPAAAAGGIFFIPATNPWVNPLMQPMPPNPFMQPSMMPPPHHPDHIFMRPGSIKKPNGLGAPPNTMGTRSYHFRHEMIIRNSDSGKIMGVKGRRVAAVEQLTNTVISFQKVDSKSKERTLTITAATMESIEKAKDMIIDTIRRNVSPIRTPDTMMTAPSDISGGVAPLPASNNDDDDDDGDIKLEQTADGKITFCCDDPEMLAAAQEALNAYLRVRNRPNASEREKKKERRKSMPLQSAAVNSASSDATTANASSGGSKLKSAKGFHGSTPNLADGLAATTNVVVVSSTRPPPIRYDREYLMKCRDEKPEMNAKMMEDIRHTAPDILIQ